MVTDERLAEIEERHQAATRGPWMIARGRDCCRVVGGDFSTVMDNEQYYPEPVDPKNQEFCAHAHQDIPALIAEVKRLRAEYAKLLVRSRTRSGHA